MRTISRKQRQMNKSELKRCPFCGGTKLEVNKCGAMDIGYNCRVRCLTEGCYANLHPHGLDPRTKEEAIAAWNRRAGEGEK